MTIREQTEGLIFGTLFIAALGAVFFATQQIAG